MANNKLSVLKFLEQSYDIDALYLGGVAAGNFYHTGNYPTHLQTKYQAENKWYGTSYPIYARWETPSVCKWIVDGYETKVDRATKDADGNTISSTYSKTGHTHRDSDILLYSSPESTSPYTDLNEWASVMNGTFSLVDNYLADRMFQPHNHSAYNIALLDNSDNPYIDLQSFHNQVREFMDNGSGGSGGGSSYTTLDRDFYLDFNDGNFRYADNQEAIPSSNGYDDVFWDDTEVGWLMEWFRRDVFKLPPVINNGSPEYDATQIAARGRCLFPSENYFSEPSLPLMVITTMFSNYFSIPLLNWDSMVVECLGGPGSEAECTMTIDLYTRTAEHYRLQVASTTGGGMATGEYVTKGVQRIDNKVGSSNETIKDIKVVSSLPSNPDSKTLYIVV